jgi:hypothetical protein
MWKQKLINLLYETLGFLEEEAKTKGLTTTAHIRAILMDYVRKRKENEN